MKDRLFWQLPCCWQGNTALNAKKNKRDSMMLPLSLSDMSVNLSTTNTRVFIFKCNHKIVSGENASIFSQFTATIWCIILMFHNLRLANSLSLWSGAAHKSWPCSFFFTYRHKHVSIVLQDIELMISFPTGCLWNGPECNGSVYENLTTLK